MSRETENRPLLVVDDNVALLRVLADACAAAGYPALSAASAAEALALIEAHSGVRLMLTDVNLGGGMDGLELARQCQSARPGLKVVLMTGTGVGVEEGPVGSEFKVLVKPVRLSVLATEIRSALEGS